MQEFPTPEPISLQVRLTAGRAQVVAEDTATTSVDLRPRDEADQQAWKAVEQTRVELRKGALTIEGPERWGLRRTPELELRVTLPRDSRVRADLGSANLNCSGRLADLRANTASGDIQVDEVAGELSVRTASGDVRIARAQRAARLKSASGDVELLRADGDVDVAVASGDVVVGEAGGSVHARSASGDVRVDAASRGSLSVATASGDVHVGVRAGTGVWLDLSSMSGDTTSELTTDEPPTEGDTALKVQVRSVSGDVRVVRTG